MWRLQCVCSASTAFQQHTSSLPPPPGQSSSGKTKPPIWPASNLSDAVRPTTVSLPASPLCTVQTLDLRAYEQTQTTRISARTDTHSSRQSIGPMFSAAPTEWTPCPRAGLPCACTGRRWHRPTPATRVSSGRTEKWHRRLRRNYLPLQRPLIVCACVRERVGCPWWIITPVRHMSFVAARSKHSRNVRNRNIISDAHSFGCCFECQMPFGV